MYITQTFVEEIEITLCVSDGKGFNAGNSVLSDVLEVAGGVGAGGFTGLLIPGYCVAVRKLVLLLPAEPPLTFARWCPDTGTRLQLPSIALSRLVSHQPAAGQWPSPHLHLPK